MAQLAKQMIAVIHERKRDEIAALEKTRLQALGSRVRKKERCGRGRHARGEGVLAWKALENRFNSHSVPCGYFQLVERIPREKVTAWGEKTVN